MKLPLKHILSLLFLFVLHIGHAQRFSDLNWYFSNNNRALVFGKENTAEPIIDFGKAAQSSPGEKVTITDPLTGDLVGYVVGNNVFDDTHAIMVNGNSLFVDINGTQAMAVSPVPGPGSINNYYIFHRDDTGQIFATIVNKNDQGNRTEGPPAGEVTSKNVPTGIIGRGDGMLTLSSFDGSTFWLVTQQENGGLIEFYEIPEAGGTFNSVGVVNLTDAITVSHFAFNNNTGRIAVIPQNETNIQVLNFNPSIPEIVHEETILNSFVFNETFGGSAGWSVTGDFLFFSRNNTAGGNIFRYDFQNDSTAALEAVFSTPVQESFSLKLAPDSSIYHLYRESVGGDILMGRINRPDTLISQVDYESQLFEGEAFDSEYFASFNPPESMQVQIFAMAQEDGLCMNNPIQFYPIIFPPEAIPTSIEWDFQPINMRSENYAPIMSFEEAGAIAYSVSAMINGRTVTGQGVLTIEENDLQISLPDTTICPGETLTLDAEPQSGGQGQPGAGGGPFNYLWNTGATTSTIDVMEAGTYWVVVTPETGCPVYTSTEVRVYGEDNRTANIWYFGEGAGIDFNEEEDMDPPPRSITSAHAMTAPAGTSTISDQNGQVLFYSNGNSVWNRENQVMPNGSTIGGDSLATQAVIIVPFVDDDTKYYVFTSQQVYGANTYQLKYNVVDMKEDNGRGDVIIKDVVLFTKSTEKIAAFEAGGGYWVLTHEYGNNTFRAYPVAETGVGAPVISSAGRIHTVNDPLSGQAGMKFSADGMSLATALIEGTDDYAEVFDFDQQTGEVTELRYSIDLNGGAGSNSDQVYDVHFSTGGNKLFATMNNRNGGSPGSRILEYRVDSASTEETMLASRAEITQGTAGSVNLGQVQTGPDGQLYVASEGQAFVGAILANEDTAATSSYNPQQVALTTGVSLLGLPNFVQNNAQSPQTAGMTSDTLACVEQLVTMSGSGTSDIDSVTFRITRIDDNLTVFAASAIESIDTSFVFAEGQGGLYNVSLNISNRCGFDSTIVRPLEILDTPFRPTVPQATAVCEPGGTTLDAAQGEDPTGLTFEWTDSQGNVVGTSQTYAVVRPEIYTVTITNALGCSSTANIFAGPAFDIELPPTAVICEGSELTLDPNVTADTYIWTVNGNTTPVGSDRRQTVDSSVPGTYSYVVSIEDPITPGCFTSDTTVVTINALAQANITPVQSNCGTDDGQFTFDVTTTGSYSYTVTGNTPSSGTITGPGSQTVTGLAAGSYTLTLTDNSSACAQNFDVLIGDANPGFNLTAVANNVDCSNPATVGSVTVTLDTNVYPVDYVLTNTADNTTISANNVNASTGLSFDIANVPEGNYNLVVTSVASACNATSAGLAVTVASPVVFTTNPFVEECDTGLDGVALTIDAGFTPANATFAWEDSSGNSVGNGTTVTVTQSGTYTVRGNATGSCETVQTVEVVLTIPPGTPTITQTPNCDAGTVTLEATLTTTGNYIYQWLNANDDVVGNEATIDVNISGNYRVRVRNAVDIGCFSEAGPETVTISEPIEAVLTSTPACNDGSDIFLNVEVTAGSPTSFNWTRPDGSSASGAQIQATLEGDYRVIIGDGTCSIERSINIRRQNIPEGQLPETEFYCATRADNPVLDAGGGFETYEWTRDGEPYPDAGRFLAVEAAGEYVVTMTTSIGCVQTDSVTIIESCDPKIVAPTAISVNSAPPNNAFTVFPNDFVDNFEIYIYSRWGELLFQSNTIEFKWDATVNGELVPVGTYPYVIRFTSKFEPERGTFEQQGSVTVIR